MYVVANGIVLYLIFIFIIIPYLDRGGSFDKFEQMIYKKQTPPLLYTTEKAISPVTRVLTTVQSTPKYICDTLSCST